MRQKVTVLTAVCLCLVLTFGSAFAGSRDRDDNNRSKQISTSDQGVEFNIRDEFSPQTRRITAESRISEISGGQAALSKATTLLSSAVNQDDNAAITTLNQILALDLPEGDPGSEKVLAEVNTQLSELYSHAPAKQVHYLGLALSYTSDPGQRQLLEGRISDLGGDAVSLAYRPSTNANTMAPNTVGFQDTCDQAGAVTIPVSLCCQNIDPGVGDHDWWVFDVNTSLGGAELRIETISDMPGSFTDDTDLTLWEDCDFGTGQGIGLIAFNDDKGDDFTSRIDTTCLPNETYYLEVGGFNDVAGADNFTLEIDITAECEPPMPDEFEPDNTREEVGDRIGNRDVPTRMGQQAREIQAHNIFPPGDEDWVRYQLNTNIQVNMETACGFPTIFNDFDPGCDTTQNPDTILELFYPSPKPYGGLCNQSDIGFGPPCLVNNPDCDIDGDGIVYPDDDDLAGPIPGFDACIDWIFFNPANHPFRPPDQALAVNDDISFPANPSSQLNLCMPRTNPQNQSGSLSVRNDPLEDGRTKFNWYNRVTPFDSADIFDYEIMVRNEAECDFECEPNGVLGLGANEICLGHAVNGIFDYSETIPNQDADVYAFDVAEDKRVIFETTGYDTFAVDTGIELFIGPDSNGDFFFIVDDDDGGDGFLSRLDLILPPAADLLGDPGLPGCRPTSPQCAVAGGGHDDDDDDGHHDGGGAASNFIVCDLGGSGHDDDDDDSDDSDDGAGQAPAELCPSYYLNVTSFFLNPNFPYTLLSTVEDPPLVESEPNDDCMTNANPASLGDTILASINPTCDFDTYKLSLAADTEVTISTNSSGDTSVELVDCSDQSVITCDDDGGPGLLSLIQGCLPAGDLCAKVRAFSGFVTFDYEVTFEGGAACTATDPPCPGTTCGDRLFRCDDTPPGEFDTCPN